MADRRGRVLPFSPESGTRLATSGTLQGTPASGKQADVTAPLVTIPKPTGRQLFPDDEAAGSAGSPKSIEKLWAECMGGMTERQAIKLILEQSASSSGVPMEETADALIPSDEEFTPRKPRKRRTSASSSSQAKTADQQDSARKRARTTADDVAEAEDDEHMPERLGDLARQYREQQKSLPYVERLRSLISKIDPKQHRPSEYASWSDAKRKAWSAIRNNPNAFFYRHCFPGEIQSTGGWSDEEEALFMRTLIEHPPHNHWGLFAMHIPGRVGYQCRNFYHYLLKQGRLKDPEYLDSSGNYTEKRQRTVHGRSSGKLSVREATKRILDVVGKSPAKKRKGKAKESVGDGDGDESSKENVEPMMAADDVDVPTTEHAETEPAEHISVVLSYSESHIHVEFSMIAAADAVKMASEAADELTPKRTSSRKKGVRRSGRSRKQLQVYSPDERTPKRRSHSADGTDMDTEDDVESTPGRLHASQTTDAGTMETESVATESEIVSEIAPAPQPAVVPVIHKVEKMKRQARPSFCTAAKHASVECNVRRDPLAVLGQVSSVQPQPDAWQSPHEPAVLSDVTSPVPVGLLSSAQQARRQLVLTRLDEDVEKAVKEYDSGDDEDALASTSVFAGAMRILWNKFRDLSPRQRRRTVSPSMRSSDPDALEKLVDEIRNGAVAELRALYVRERVELCTSLAAQGQATAVATVMGGEHSRVEPWLPIHVPSTTDLINVAKERTRQA